MKTAFLFPGQGAQYAGMGKDFYETSLAARELFELASDTASVDLKKLLFEGSDEDLKRTVNTQLAVGLVDCVAALCAREHGIFPTYCAGFSLGEFPALVESGVLEPRSMFALLAERARLMEKAIEKGGGGGMAAILGLKPEAIEAAIASSGIEGVWVVNYNSPQQSVISGVESALGTVEGILKAAGAKRMIRLKVSGAFHSPLMAYARDGLKEIVPTFDFHDPLLKLLSNVTGKPVSTGAEAKDLAIQQVISPVRWLDEERFLMDDGVGQCFEVGPGTVLQGLWKAVSADLPCTPFGTVDQIAAVSL